MSKTKIFFGKCLVVSNKRLTFATEIGNNSDNLISTLKVISEWDASAFIQEQEEYIKVHPFEFQKKDV